MKVNYKSMSIEFDVSMVLNLLYEKSNQLFQKPFSFMVTVGISNRKPTRVSIKMRGQAHLNHLLKGILAISSTPIKTPEVGVIRLVNPSPI